MPPALFGNCSGIHSRLAQKTEKTKTRTNSKTNQIKTSSFVLSQTHNNHIYFHKRRCFPNAIINNFSILLLFLPRLPRSLLSASMISLCRESLPNHVAEMHQSRNVSPFEIFHAITRDRRRHSLATPRDCHCKCHGSCHVRLHGVPDNVPVNENSSEQKTKSECTKRA